MLPVLVPLVLVMVLILIPLSLTSSSAPFSIVMLPVPKEKFAAVMSRIGLFPLVVVVLGITMVSFDIGALGVQLSPSFQLVDSLPFHLLV